MNSPVGNCLICSLLFKIKENPSVVVGAFVSIFWNYLVFVFTSPVFLCYAGILVVPEWVTESESIPLWRDYSVDLFVLQSWTLFISSL